MYIADGDTPCQENDPRIWFSKDGTKRTALAKGALRPLS